MMIALIFIRILQVIGMSSWMRMCWKSLSLKEDLEKAKHEAELWKTKCSETSKKAETEEPKEKRHRSTHHVTNGRSNSMLSWTQNSSNKDNGEACKT
jgi:hypothetical protein